jgi:uncharacterized membrane protein (DUF2068 family)
MTSTESLSPQEASSAHPVVGPTYGERSVACFEAAKGIFVILAGFGLLSLLHRDAQHFVKFFVDHLHVNPASRYSHIFLALGSVSDQRLWMFAAMTCAYASLRLAEAYGLWTGRQWAKWVAVASGGAYFPYEVYELYRGVSWIKLAAFLLNAAIVVYMVYALRRADRMTAASRA